MRTNKRARCNEFNADYELNQIRKKYPRKKNREYESKLDVYADEIFVLRRAGASSTEIVRYLSDRYGIKVWHTTVLRFLKQRAGN